MASEEDPNSSQPTQSPLSNAPEPDERKNRGTERRVTHDTWEAMYQAWKAGERSPKHLGIKFNVSEDSAHRYINRGVKSRGWPGFFVRQADENTAVQEAKLEAAKRMSEVMVDEFAKVTQESLKTFRIHRVACHNLVTKLLQAAQGVSMSRQAIVWKVVMDKDGNPHQVRETVERPVDATELATMARAISTALVAANRTELALLGGPTTDEKTIPEGAALSTAELEFIEKNDGALPPGVSPEAFLAKMAATYGIRVPGAGGSN